MGDRPVMLIVKILAWWLAIGLVVGLTIGRVLRELNP